MKNLLIFLFSLLLFLGCSRQKNVYQKKVIGCLFLEVDTSWKLDTLKGIDSYAAYLIDLANKDTFHIEYGKPEVIYKLFQKLPVILPIKEKENILTLSKYPLTSDDVFFSEYPEEDREQGIFDKNYYTYDTINSIIVKIVNPKKIGYGMTGVYIPKLKNGNSFSMYALNLDSTSHLKALKMFESIQYNN